MFVQGAIIQWRVALLKATELTIHKEWIKCEPDWIRNCSWIVYGPWFWNIFDLPLLHNNNVEKSVTLNMEHNEPGHRETAHQEGHIRFPPIPLWFSLSQTIHSTELHKHSDKYQPKSPSFLCWFGKWLIAAKAQARWYQSIHRCQWQPVAPTLDPTVSQMIRNEHTARHTQIRTVRVSTREVILSSLRCSRSFATF